MAQLKLGSTMGGKMLETAEGAQAKVNALAGVGNIKTVKQLDEELKATTTSIDKSGIITPVTFSGDLNTVTGSGTFFVTPEATNLPGPIANEGFGAFLEQSSATPTKIIQKIASITDGNVTFTRSFMKGRWSIWEEMPNIHTMWQNIDRAVGLGADPFVNIPVMLNGWQKWATRVPQYAVIGAHVYFRGGVVGGTCGDSTPAFKISPAPTSTRVFVASTVAATNDTDRYQRVVIDTSGYVSFSHTQANKTTVQSLDGIYYESTWRG